jgi:hypothetical protein
VTPPCFSPFNCSPRIAFAWVTLNWLIPRRPFSPHPPLYPPRQLYDVSRAAVPTARARVLSPPASLPAMGPGDDGVERPPVLEPIDHDRVQYMDGGELVSFTDCLEVCTLRFLQVGSRGCNSLTQDLRNFIYYPIGRGGMGSIEAKLPHSRMFVGYRHGPEYHGPQYIWIAQCSGGSGSRRLQG